jgi:hypothetical protein
MQQLRIAAIIFAVFMLSSCALVTKYKVDKRMQLSANNLSAGNYCGSLIKLKEALRLAEAGNSEWSQKFVLQNYVDSYNTVMDKVADINAQSAPAEQRLKANTWRCWIPAMQEIAPKMAPTLKAKISPAYALDRVTVSEAERAAGNAYYRQAMKQSNNLAKFYDILMTYHYDNQKPNIADELRQAYNNAIGHIIIKNAEDGTLNGTPFITSYVIPKLTRSFKTLTLEELTKNIPAAYNRHEPFFDYENKNQKAGNNINITLRIGDIQRTVEDFRRNVPVERESKTRRCYDVNVPIEDDDRKHDEHKKPPRTRTERRCDDYTTTYTENIVETGIRYKTRVTTNLSISINGRNHVNKKPLKGYATSENTGDDPVAVGKQIATMVYDNTMKAAKEINVGK